MPKKTDPRVLSQMLASHSEALVSALGFNMGNATKSGDRMGLLNHVRGEKNQGSFWIDIKGGRAGHWIDYVDPDHLRGDALALVHYANSGQPKPTSAPEWKVACEWAERWLGLAGDAAYVMDVAGLEAVATRALEQRGKADADEAILLDGERKRLKARWLRAQPLNGQSGAWKYLAGRGIDVEGLLADDRLSSALRAESEGVYSWNPDSQTGVKFPTLLCGLWRADGAFAGVHITFLDPETHGKIGATIGVARKMRPKGIAGAFIPIAKGRSLLSTSAMLKAAPDDPALQGEVLAVCEGVEDALSLAMMYPDFRIWCAGSVWNIGQMPVPPHISDLIVMADNDIGQSARDALRRSLQSLRAKMVPEQRLKVWRAIGVKDLNEAIQARAAAKVLS
jgi:hypothetical protein